MSLDELAALTAEEKRIRIAELCGWRECRPRASMFDRPWISGINPRPDRIELIIPCDGSEPRPATAEDYGNPDTLPDYLNDLNAMYDAEKALLDPPFTAKWLNYIDQLGLLSGSCIHAPAKKRADALLLALG